MARDRKHRKYKPKPVHIPMTTGLRDPIALHLHAAIAGLCSQYADIECFDAAAGTFNMIAFTIANDRRFATQRLILAAGSLALEAVGERLQGHVPKVNGAVITPGEAETVRATAAMIDDILPKLNVAAMYVAERAAVATVRDMRAGARQPRCCDERAGTYLKILRS